MYSIHKTLTKEHIYEKITGYHIFKRYCPGLEEIGKAFKSPVRDTDNKPSAFVIYFKGDYLLKDFGSKSFRPVQFVMDYFGLSYKQALQKINADFNLSLGDNDLSIGNDGHLITPYTLDEIQGKDKPLTVIGIKQRSWEDIDRDYWLNNYHITQQTLEKFSVKPISHFTINDYLYFSHKLSYSYDYYWEDGVFRRKIYQPLSSSKWFSNGGAVVQGEGMLPKNGDLLIITSSLKDVMTLYELGYTAIAPTSETTFVPDEYFIKQNKRFKQIILFMDSDDTGIKANERLSERWRLWYISIPNDYHSKDISDMVKTHGSQITKDFLHEKIFEIN